MKRKQKHPSKYIRYLLLRKRAICIHIRPTSKHFSLVILTFVAFCILLFRCSSFLFCYICGVLTQYSQLSPAEKSTPSSPGALHITHQTATSCSIAWEKPLDIGSSAIMHYILEKREAGCTVWATLTTLPPSVTECELENMAAGKEYYVRIKAVNKFGVSEPSVMLRPICVRGAEKGMSSGWSISPLLTSCQLRGHFDSTDWLNQHTACFLY